MESFRIHTGLVAPLDRENVDTDAIIPQQFLKSIKRSGFGPNLFDEVAAFPGYQLTVDLERQVVVKPDGSELAFEVESFRRHCLLGGLDDIGLTLQHADAIRAYEAERLLRRPWLAHRL
ncbi:MAG TPA: hypothetical protein VNV16_15235 [Methylibium sp.]|nr:hypothetical protein [Methylibium sp.]